MVDGIGEGLGEEGCLGEVNSVGRLRRWEHGGTNWRMEGPFTKRGVKYFWAFLPSWPDAVTPIIYLMY